MGRFVLWSLFFLCSFRAFAFEFVVSAAGDTNFSQSFLAYGPEVIRAEEARKYGHWYAWQETTQWLSPDLVDGDLNFLNLETVLTDDIHSLQVRKGPHFAFVSHINGVRNLAAVGFNLFSLANNHTYDFGDRGLLETLRTSALVESEFPGTVFTGIDFKETYGQPRLFQKAGLKIAFASINGVGGRQPALPTSDMPSMITIRNGKDYRRLIDNFSQIEADLKILSVHNGAEGSSVIEAVQKENFHYAVDHGGINLIFGHHPHVVRPVEIYNSSVIFYSLGNFLMLGAANINKKSPGENFGGLGKVYFDVNRQGLELAALKMVPLTNVHVQPKPLGPKAAKSRIQVLNRVTQKSLPKTGVVFGWDQWGQGVYCLNPRPGTKASAACAL